MWCPMKRFARTSPLAAAALTVAALTVAALALAACASGAADGALAPGSMRVGSLPASVSTVAPTTAPAVAAGVLPASGPIGGRVVGNRVLMIGDSVLASTSSRYGGEMCAALVPLGWQVELDAETGQFAPWGNDVLDDRLAAGWDAALVLLGNNYLGDQEAYRSEIEQMVTRLAPAPVVLVRVTEFTDSRVQVNAVIDELAARYPQVVVLDWASITKADGSLTGHDGLHLSESGRAQLAAEVANFFGQAPVAPGACLPTRYTDDTRGPVTGTTLPNPGATPTVAPSVVPTTAAPTTVATPPVTDPPVVTTP